ncbi:MAG: ATPase, T2SS/T4P/T4SS family, partial [Bacillota bacterium]
ISGGVSGVPKNFFYSFNQRKDFSNIAKLPSEYDSIWIFFKGKSIHLKFLSFKTQRELIRICKNIYKYGNPGQLTESQGYKVNKMKDGSRVVVVRPPFCESWAFFVRKFDSIEKKEISELIVDTNNKLCINFLKWIIKGLSVSAITGSQGVGKTTLLMSLIKFINPTFNLRIQEMAFELHLRKIYPYRNILTFKQTKDIAGQEGLNLQKKTDGSVNILGEVASAPVASWMIQMSQVASLFTIFTHHAKTSDHLIKSLRNNLLETKIFSNEKIATEQVADVIDYDIHLAKSQDGHRYIERISQIVMPKSKRIDLNQNINKDDLISIMTKYFQKEINNKFYIKDIIRWDNGQYIVKNSLSQREINRIKKSLNSDQKNLFSKFLKKNGLIK